MRLLVDILRRTEGANVRKMGSNTPNTDCHNHHHHYPCQQGELHNDGHHHHHLHDEYCGDGDYCCFVVGSSSGGGSSSQGAAIMTCPLRRGITTNNNDDVSHDGEEDVNRYHVCDTNCPSICCYNNNTPTTCNDHCPCLISCGNSFSSLSTFPCPAATPTTRNNYYFSKNKLNTTTTNAEEIVNDTSRCSSRRLAVEANCMDNLYNNDSSSNSSNCRRNRDRGGSIHSKSNESNEELCTSNNSINSINSANGSSSDNDKSIKRRISSSHSLLTRPCALYLFTVLVILDLSDFSSILITSSFGSSGTASDSEVLLNNVASTIGRYNTFLVNGAFDNKNGHHHHQNGLGGLTVSPEVPILSMDSVFFDDSFGNRMEMTGSSESAEQQGENISDEEETNNNAYDEDDDDSVEISRIVEPRTLKRLESQFLKLFGMSKRPERAEDQQKKQIKVPKYLLDLYQKQSGTELPTSNLNLPGRHTRTANTVRTFYHQPGNSKTPSYPWKGRENHIEFNLESIPSMEKVTGAELRIPFEITVDDSETVNSASFRESSVDNHGSEHEQLKGVRILLHDMVKPATSPKSKKPKETHLLEPITYPIDSKMVVLSKRRNGTSTFWLTFDVFPAVARWMSNPKTNYGLVLEILGVTNEGQFVPQETVVQRHNLRVKRDVDEEDDDQVENSVDASDEGSSTRSDHANGGSGKGRNSITTESSSSSSFSSSSTSATSPSSKSTQDSGESQTLSMAETPASSSVVSSSSSSSPTEVGVATDDGFISSNNNERKNIKKVGDASSSIILFTYSDDGHNPVKTRDAKTLSRHYRSAQANRRRKNPRNKNRKRNLCQRHAMFVDFQDVGWNDWIVAPPGYAAYYCSGECPFPMAEHLNATNHAVIQALVHSMNPALVPPPCCVPTKYSSLSLLYTDSSDKIVLKNYNEMVVDSCGCS